jgi:UDP-glucuronate decarboxylase
MQHKKDPLQTIRTNVMGTWNLLNLAADLQVPFLQASTAEIYGGATASPQSESYLGSSDTFGEMASYVESKRLAETLCSEFHTVHKVPIRVARIFSTYGPGMAWDNGRVMANFIAQALSGKPITLYGDGQDQRSFLFIDDLVTGVSSMMDSKELKVGPLNLGSTEVISLRKLAEKIIDVTNSSSELKFSPARSSAAKALVPDIELAKELLSWEPQVDLDTGLSRTIESFLSSLKNR